MSDKDLTGFDLIGKDDLPAPDPKGTPRGVGRLTEEVEKREVARLAEIAKRNSWPVRLPFDLAMEMEEADETFKRYEVTPERALHLLGHKEFVESVRTWREIIVKEGVSFRTKARLAAEDLLQTAYLLATDPTMPASVRADMVKWHAKVAGLEPKQDPEGGAGGGGQGITLKIEFTGTPGQQPQVYNADAKRVEDKGDVD